jgi:hypothetical protein
MAKAARPNVLGHRYLKRQTAYKAPRKKLRIIENKLKPKGQISERGPLDLH